jgi:hypothetical protein
MVSCARVLSVVVLLLLCHVLAMGQELPKQDTTVKVYEKLEKAAQRTWFTTALYDLFFKPIAFTGERQGGQYKRLANRPFGQFEGDPIRSIRIVTLDPFGYDVYDTTEVPTLGTERFGNALHAKTLRMTVKNLLLFREGEPFDSLLVKESERLIRQELYIQEVFFYPQHGGAGRDSVDLLIRVLDSWSLLPELGISGTRFSTGFTENNLGGLNHVFYNYYTWNHALNRHAFESDYSVRNIRSTYISAKASYRLNEVGDYQTGVAVDRPFFSTVTRWAGGMSAYYQVKTDTVYQLDSTARFLTSSAVPQDYWAAGAWQLAKGNTEDDRATNLIVGVRAISMVFNERPAGFKGDLDIYRNRATFLAGIGLSTRKYLRDRYIFNYGFIEDVPIGRSYGLVGGYEMRQDPRWYVGAHYTWGQYYRWGYFSTSIEYGNYFRAGSYEQGTVRGGISYFTGLLQLGKWRFRQFVKPSFTVGMNRLPNDNITLNEGRGGIRGFDSAELFGTHRLLLTLQTQSYAPWRLLGFQFGPYFVFSMGALGNARDGFEKSTVYTQFGLGVLVNNRYLVFENFELSISFFPLIPGTGENNGENIFIGNTFRTTDFGFPDYGLGRPNVVGY